MVSVSARTYKFTAPGPVFGDSDDVKLGASRSFVDVVDLADYPVRHEMLGVYLRTDDRMSRGLSASVRFLDDATGKVLWEGSVSNPSASSQGYSYWNWQYIMFWIGHAWWEIDGAMLVRIEIDSEGSHIVRKIRVTDTAVPLDGNGDDEPIPPPPVDVLKVLPVPPADFPPSFLPTYRLLDEALDRKDTAGVLKILREHGLDEGSPIVFISAALAIVGVVSLIATVVGSYALAAFLFEETLQTLDITIFQAQSNGQWDLAQTGVDKKREVLEKGIWDNIKAFIPVLTIINAVDKFVDASVFKLSIDDQIISRQISRVVEPKAGAIKLYSEALDAGTDPAAYAPLAPALLRINVNAVGGEVEWNGTGVSAEFPFEISLPAGNYNVKISAVGMIPLTKSISLDPYEDKIVDYFLKGGSDVSVEEMGTLIVTSTPTGAKIYIDQEYVFEQTDTSLPVQVGEHILTLKKTGYEDVTKGFSIKTGQDTRIYLALPEISGNGNGQDDGNGEGPEEEIVISLDPGAPEYNAWKVTIRGIDSSTNEDLAAWILINDVFMGKATPASFFLAPKATYNIKLRLKGYKQGEVTFTTKELPTP